MKYGELTESPKYFEWNWVDDTFDIKRYLRDELYVYDCDICGDSLTFWVVVKEGQTQFIRCYHDWYVERDPEFEVINSFEITEVTKEEMLAEDKYGYIKENLKYLV